MLLFTSSVALSWRTGLLPNGSHLQSSLERLSPAVACDKKKKKIGGKNLDVELRVQSTTREVSGRQFWGFLMANAEQPRSLETALLLEKGGSALRGKWRRKNQGN